MITPVSETPEWLSWTSPEPLVVLQVWDGVPSLALIPTLNGALLWWMFDQDEDGSDYLLITHLTDTEAQAVHDSLPGSGVLEAVRATLKEDKAVIARRAPGTLGVALTFLMPREESKEEFIDDIFSLREALAHQPMKRKSLKNGVTDPISHLADLLVSA